MYAIGIDIGSVATKTVVYNGSISAQVSIPTGWSPRDASRQALALALARAGIERSRVAAIVATGYGRVTADIADRTVTEITCHARGAWQLHPQLRAVLDIGGQDSKVIQIDAHGRVVDFAMNDKCAAGTGRFLEVMARILETGVQGLDALAAGCAPAPISSMCTVFAESEVVGLLARGVPRGAIACGVLESIATRVSALLSRFDIAGGIAFTGGLARSTVLQQLLQTRCGQPIYTTVNSQLAGALGAAIIGWQQREHPDADHCTTDRDIG